jgi:hypothetical protein
MTKEPNPLSPKVLVLAGPWRGKSHDPGCNWVRGVNLDYKPVDPHTVPASLGRCSHCGGGSRTMGDARSD